MVTNEHNIQNVVSRNGMVGSAKRSMITITLSGRLQCFLIVVDVESTSTKLTLHLCIDGWTIDRGGPVLPSDLFAFMVSWILCFHDPCFHESKLSFFMFGHALIVESWSFLRSGLCMMMEWGWCLWSLTQIISCLSSIVWGLVARYTRWVKS